MHNRTGATSTTGLGPTLDDFHVTVRMGSTEDVCNLHGHLYIHRGGRTKMPIEMMLDHERMVVLGRGRELRIWGLYPEQSEEWPRLGGELPTYPTKWVTKDGYPKTKYPKK